MRSKKLAKPAFTTAKFLAVFFFILVSACSTMLPPAALEAYDACQYDKAATIFKKKAEAADKDVVLYQLALLSTAMRAGAWAEAERASLGAQQNMWGYEGQGRGAASLASAESIKIFKGEPFEKAMAAIYAGIMYYNKKDYDNARASFSKSLLAMGQKKESNRQDFALGYFLQAKVFLKLGDKDNAKIALDKAAKVYPQYKNLFDPEVVRKSNALFFVEIGTGPLKARSGPGDSLIDWKRRYYPDRYASVFVDGKEVSRPAELVDMTAQAQSKGSSGKDTIQATKGVARELGAVTTVIALNEAKRGNETAGWVALGAGLFTLANQSQADTRQWPFLPDLVMVSPIQLATGKHHIKVQRYNSSQQPLYGYDQEWEYTVDDQTDSIFVVPSTRCRVNTRIGGN